MQLMLCFCSCLDVDELVLQVLLLKLLLLKLLMLLLPYKLLGCALPNQSGF